AVALGWFHAALQASLRAARHDRVAYALIGIAVCAGRLGSPDLAVRLHAAADALHAQIGLRAIEPLESAVRAADHARLREALGDRPFDEAYAAGALRGERAAVLLAARFAAQHVV